MRPMFEPSLPPETAWFLRAENVQLTPSERRPRPFRARFATLLLRVRP